MTAAKKPRAQRASPKSKIPPLLDDALRNVQSADDAIQLIEDHYGEVFTSGEDVPAHVPRIEAVTDAELVFKELCAYLSYYVKFASESHIIAEALYVQHTYAIDACRATGFLHITGPTGSGKTTNSEALLEVVHNPYDNTLQLASTAPKLYEGINESDIPTTVLLDQMDTQLTAHAYRSQQPSAMELYTILNAAHRRKGSVTRIRNGQRKQFKIFAPFIIAGKGSIHDDSLESRCITISLRRHKREQMVSYDDMEDAGRIVRENLQAWASPEKIAQLRAAKPEPRRDEIDDARVWDVWKPLIAIADSISDEIGELARNAMVELVTDSGHAQQSSFTDDFMTGLQHALGNSYIQLASYVTEKPQKPLDEPIGGWTNESLGWTSKRGYFAPYARARLLINVQEQRAEIRIPYADWQLFYEKVCRANPRKTFPSAKDALRELKNENLIKGAGRANYDRYALWQGRKPRPKCVRMIVGNWFWPDESE